MEFGEWKKQFEEQMGEEYKRCEGTEFYPVVLIDESLKPEVDYLESTKHSFVVKTKRNMKDHPEPIEIITPYRKTLEKNFSWQEGIPMRVYLVEGLKKKCLK